MTAETDHHVTAAVLDADPDQDVLGTMTADTAHYDPAPALATGVGEDEDEDQDQAHSYAVASDDQTPGLALDAAAGS